MATTELKFLIRADTAEGQAALNRFREQLRALGRDAGDAAKKPTSAWGSFAGVLKGAAPLIAGLGISFSVLTIAQTVRGWTSEAIKFQEEFANVTTLIDTSQVSTEELRRGVLELGGQLGTSTDLAKGLYQTLSAGVDPSKSIKFLGDAARFATAALTDTFTSVDVLTTILNAYGLEASQATEVSDQLFEVIKQGKITGQELAASLGRVIPTAATLGIGLDQVGAAVATLTKGGIRSEEAITALNQVLISFINPSQQAADLAKELHVEMSAESIAAKGLLPSLRELALASDGNAKATATFFGNIRALKGVLALTGPQAQEFERILGVMAHTTGNVSEAFAKQTGTLGHQWAAFWNNISSLFIQATNSGGLLAKGLEAINKVLETGRLKYSDVVRAGIGMITSWSSVREATKAAGIEIENLSQRDLVDLFASVQRTGSASEYLGRILRDSGKEALNVGDNIGLLTLRFKQAKDQQELLNSVLGQFDRQGITTTGTLGNLAKSHSSAIGYIQSEQASYNALRLAAQQHGSTAENLLKIVDNLNLKISDQDKEMLKTLASEYKEIQAEEEHRRAQQALTEAQDKYLQQTKDLLHPQQDLIDKINLLSSHGYSAADMAVRLGGDLKKVADSASLLDQRLDPSIQKLLDLVKAKESEAALQSIRDRFSDLSGEIRRFIDLGATPAELLLQYGSAALKMAQDAKILGGSLPEPIKQLAELQDQINKAQSALEDIDKTAPIKNFLKLPEPLKVVTLRIHGLSEEGETLLTHLRELAKEPGKLAHDLQGLEDQGASQAVIWAEWGDRIKAAAEAAKLMGQEIPEPIKQLLDFGKVADQQKGVAKDWGDVWRNQISTVVTDLGKGFSDILFAGKSFGETFKQIFVDLGKSVVRIFTEQIFGPILQGLQGLFSGGAKGTTGAAGGASLPGLGGLNLNKLFGGLSGIAGGVGTLFLGGSLGASGLGGLLGGGAAGAIGGAGLGILGSTFLGGATSYAATGAGGLGFFGGGTAALGALGPFGLAGLGISALIPLIAKLFKKNPIESGSKEVARDFGGISVATSQIENFIKTMGISQEVYAKFRKSTMSSPAFLPILIDAAKAQGKVEDLITSFSHFETSWGTFDLSGPLREAIESGDFTAYNQAWANLFKDSDQYISALGGSLTKLFNTTVNSTGQTQQSINELGDAIRALEDQGGLTSDVLQQFTGDILAADTAARESGFTLDDSVAKYVDLARALEGATGEQQQLLIGLLQLQEAPKRVTNRLDELVANIGLLEDHGATTEQVLQLMGGSLAEAAAAAKELGIEIPPRVQDLLDLANAANGASDATEGMAKNQHELANSLGFAGDAADAFEAGQKSFQDTLDSLSAGAAQLSGEVYAYASALKGTIPDVELQQKAWELFGGRIASTYNQLVDFHQEIPPFIQMLIDWATNNGYMIDSEGHLAEAIKETETAISDASDKVAEIIPIFGFAGAAADAFRQGQQKMNQSIIDLTTGAGELSGEIFAYATALRGTIPDVELQNRAWDIFGNRILSTYNDLVDFHQEIPPFIQMLVNWATQNGYIIDSQGHLTKALEETRNELGLTGDEAEAYLEGQQKMRDSIANLTLDAARLSGEIVAWSETLRGTMSDIDLQNKAWGVFGDRIVSTFNSLVDLHQEIPPFIQMLIDWAVANGKIEISLNGLAEAVGGVSEATQQGLDQWASYSTGAGNLVQQIMGWTSAAIEQLGLDLSDQDAVLQLQKFAWETFGQSVLSTIDALEKAGLPIPPLLLQMKALAEQMGWVAAGFNNATTAAYSFEKATSGVPAGLERAVGAYEAANALRPLFIGSATTFDAVKQTALSILDRFGPDVLSATVNALLNQGGPIPDILSALRETAAGIAGVPEFQEGGFVPRTGPAILHQGEFVLPKNIVATVRGGSERQGGYDRVEFSFSPTLVFPSNGDPNAIRKVVLEALETNVDRFARRSAAYLEKAKKAG